MARRMSYGICQKCGHRTTKGRMLRHIQKCRVEESLNTEIYQLRVEAKYYPEYWLDIEINDDRNLEYLDRFLRAIWLECCGHMSQFHINDHHYVMPYDGSFEIWEHEGDMEIKVSEAIGKEIVEFRYEYDFGTTTHLKLKLVDIRKGKKIKKGLRLLAQNEVPEWKCAKCDQPATEICVYCVYENGDAYCDEHKDGHGCEEEYFLQVVNSPRTGECGYDGPDEQPVFWE